MATTATEPKNALAFGMVASAWMCDPNHSLNARVLYSILAAYTCGYARQSTRCVPNRHRLAAMLGVDADAFTAALAELEEAGMVTATWRADRRGRVTTVYQLHDAALLFGAVTADEGAADETAGSAL